MKFKNPRVWRYLSLVATVMLISGCASTTQETARSLYGPMPPRALAHTVRQLDAMNVDYEIRNGNEIFLTASERRKIHAALSGDLSNPNFEISVEADRSE